MKKRLWMTMAVLAAAVMAAGCGEPDDASDQTGGSVSQAEGSDVSAVPSGEDKDSEGVAYVPLKELQAEQYVTLGDYLDLNVTVDAKEANDENTYELLNSLYVLYVGAENGGIRDRAVEKGDTVVIDFEGKRDGVAFEGGTAKGHDLTIGSGGFIAGFEDGLIGVMPGETVDLNLTFPDPYENNPDLAGQPVVFTVTVQFIRPARVELADMQDDVAAAVAQNEVGDFSLDTVPKLQAYLKEYLEERYQNAFREGVAKLVLERCEFKELPESLTSYYRQSVTGYYEAMFGGDPTLYFLYYYNMDYQAHVDETVERTVKQNLAFQIIADRENLNVGDEELEEKLLERAKEAGYEDVEEYLGDTDREEWRDSMMNEKVMDFLLERAVILK